MNPRYAMMLVHRFLNSNINFNLLVLPDFIQLVFPVVYNRNLVYLIKIFVYTVDKLIF